ncbi:hypothetical protein Lser_V15G09029 [Lactuca serriola]
MSIQDNNGLPRSFGNTFPLPSDDDLPLSNQCENDFSSSRNDGSGHHVASTLPPPPLVTLLTSHFPQVERYETTQSLLV